MLWCQIIESAVDSIDDCSFFEYVRDVVGPLFVVLNCQVGARCTQILISVSKLHKTPKFVNRKSGSPRSKLNSKLRHMTAVERNVGGTATKVRILDCHKRWNSKEAVFMIA